MNNTAGATSGTETASPSGAFEFYSVFSEECVAHFVQLCTCFHDFFFRDVPYDFCVKYIQYNEQMKKDEKTNIFGFFCSVW